jgi:hypothetical protein
MPSATIASTAAGDARVLDDFDLVLLVGAVAAVQAGGGTETERSCGAGHRPNINSAITWKPCSNGREPAFTTAPADRAAHGTCRPGQPDRPQSGGPPAPDDLTLRRLKKRRLLLRDQIAQLESQLDPPEPA